MPPEEKKSESTILKHPILSGSVLSLAVLAVFGFWLYVQTDSYVPDTLYKFFSHTIPKDTGSTLDSPQLINNLPPPSTDPAKVEIVKRLIQNMPPPSQTTKQPAPARSTTGSQSTTSSQTTPPSTTQSSPDPYTLSPAQQRLLQMMPPPMSTK